MHEFIQTKIKKIQKIYILMSDRTKCKTWIRLNMQKNKYNPVNKASRIEKRRRSGRIRSEARFEYC